MNFAEKMYEKRYEKRLSVIDYLVGFPEPASANIIVVPMTKKDFMEMCHGTFEELSTANKSYKINIMGKKSVAKRGKKHLRLHFKATELYRYAINQVNGKDSELWRISGQHFEECRKVVGNIRNQKNKGYALELAILGDQWDAYRRGLDTDDGGEIKFFNGQIEL